MFMGNESFRALKRQGVQRVGQALLVGSVVAGLSACAGMESVQDRDMQSIQYRQVVDLSHTISTDIPLWPGDPLVEFETVATLDKDGYYLRSFSIGEHSATHMNAPNSFHVGGQGIDGYSPESLVRPVTLIDVREQVEGNADYVVTVEDVLAWERENGEVQPGTVVLFHTGWQQRWQNPEAFMNADSAGGLHFPGVGGETTRFLLEQRDIAGVGIDTHGADPGQDSSYATNTQVLARNGIILENLANLDRLPPTGATIIIGVLRLKEGSGSPVSVLALIP